RKPTARNSAARSPQNDRTAARFSAPGLTVTTTKIAARVKARSTGWGTGGRSDGAPGAVIGSTPSVVARQEQPFVICPIFAGLPTNRTTSLRTNPRLRPALIHHRFEVGGAAASYR